MTEEEIVQVRKLLHTVNNKVGAILATAEMMQMDQLTPKATDRARVIESNALELRDLVRQIGERYLK